MLSELYSTPPQRPALDKAHQIFFTSSPTAAFFFFFSSPNAAQEGVAAKTDMISPDILQLGLMASLRSGVWYQDMLLMLMVPLLLQATIVLKEEVQSRWSWSKRAERHIVYEHNGYGSCFDRSHSRNHLLIRAVLLYINRKRLALHRAEMCLVHLNPEARITRSEDDDEKGTRSSDCHRLICTPPAHTQVTLDNGIVVKLERTFVDNSKTTRHRNSLELKGDSEEQLDSFVQDAYLWHQDEIKRETEGVRYMHFPKYEQNHWECQRYRLSDSKTFSSLFFPQKEQFLQLLETFERRSGKFAVEGFPHKMGVLLHGPPGTGKTSLIKAVAHRTERHIVHIPLSRIETNQQLRDFMYNIGSPDVEEMSALSFSNVVFCMEEVDLISKITQQRRATSEQDHRAKAEVVSPPPTTAGPAIMTNGIMTTTSSPDSAAAPGCAELGWLAGSARWHRRLPG